jgi:hypothetical protein
MLVYSLLAASAVVVAGLPAAQSQEPMSQKNRISITIATKQAIFKVGDPIIH